MRNCRAWQLRFLRTCVFLGVYGISNRFEIRVSDSEPILSLCNRFEIRGFEIRGLILSSMILSSRGRRCWRLLEVSRIIGFAAGQIGQWSGTNHLPQRSAVMSTTTPVTADHLLRMPDDGHRYELVAGELRRMVPAGWRHGAVGAQLFNLLSRHVHQEQLGRTFLAETGFLIARDPDTVRAPDIAFIHKDHLPAVDPEEVFWPGAPDLAVEVVSPGDTMGQIDEKVKAWLDAGTGMVWVVNPQWRNVTAYRSSVDIKTLTENDELAGDDVVPGFRCQVQDVFVDL